jgi:hypothetical protein
MASLLPASSLPCYQEVWSLLGPLCRSSLVLTCGPPCGPSCGLPLVSLWSLVVLLVGLLGALLAEGPPYCTPLLYSLSNSAILQSHGRRYLERKLSVSCVCCVCVCVCILLCHCHFSSVPSTFLQFTYSASRPWPWFSSLSRLPSSWSLIGGWTGYTTFFEVMRSNVSESSSDAFRLMVLGRRAIMLLLLISYRCWLLGHHVSYRMVFVARARIWALLVAGWFTEKIFGRRREPRSRTVMSSHRLVALEALE